MQQNMNKISFKLRGTFHKWKQRETFDFMLNTPEGFIGVANQSYLKLLFLILGNYIFNSTPLVSSDNCNENI